MYNRKIKELLYLSGKTQQRLAQELGTNQRQISRWVHNKGSPSVKFQFKIDLLLQKYKR